ncbi:MAG: hypothetical protein J5850_00855 [Clostridia bacterium]|nr:hypothetical protein [Clostridia bacterium]
MKKNRTYITQGKRVSLRCPLVLEKSVFESNSDEQFVLTMDIDYPENASTDETVKAIVLIVRCMDANGELIKPIDGNSDIFAKQIQFGQEGFPVGEHSQFSFEVDIDAPEDGVKSIEVSIGRILFESGAVVDYMHGDFFENTGVIVPLGKAFKGEKLDEINEKFGVSATCVPERLSDVVWRCTCSELCQEDVCPNCGNTKEDVFGYFGDTSELVRPKSKKWKILLIVAAVLVALIIIEAIVFGIASSRKKPVVTTGAPVTTEAVTTEPVVTTIPVEDQIEALVDAYMALNQYENALLVAESNGMGFEKINEVCQKATDYYVEQKDYETALKYAERLQNYDKTALYETAYARSYSQGNYEAAYNYAVKLGDLEKQTQIMNHYLNQMLGEHRYDEAIELANTNLPDKKENIISQAVDYYCSLNDYDKALEYAEQSVNENLPARIYNSAANYYSEEGDFDSAMSYALLGMDATTIGNISNQLSDFGLKKYGTVVFSYLSEANKRRCLATKISAGRFGAAVKEDGTVSYGAGRLYTPPEGLTAVSVSVGYLHVVVLLSDGTVVAFGDNTYGQCETSDWSKVVAISAGKNHTVALRSDGSVIAVGDNSKGQTKVSAVRNGVAISAGDANTVILLNSGMVTAIGDNSSGQCDTDTWTDIIGIAAGSDFTLAVKSNGTVVGCGNKSSGKLDTDSWTDVVYVAAGLSTSACVKSDGTVLVSGGTIGQGKIDPFLLSSIVEVAAGEFGVLALNSSGNIFSLGFGAPKIN